MLYCPEIGREEILAMARACILPSVSRHRESYRERICERFGPKSSGLGYDRISCLYERRETVLRVPIRIHGSLGRARLSADRRVHTGTDKCSYAAVCHAEDVSAYGTRKDER
ncbi:hypothetical protein HCTV-16_gp168 [Haloarcula virus HCTV-16]|nr:hypothetical protein HCTV-16_gp1 [Haloarcula virus HCTV-16]UBF23151.1 hypothetical protein HCTV-16_gp168 [Haloarcula virus HCTV-16]